MPHRIAAPAAPAAPTLALAVLASLGSTPGTVRGQHSPDRRTTAGAPTPATWTVEEEPLLRLGTLDGPDEQILTAAGDGLVLTNGTVVLAMNSPHILEIRFFDRSGRVIARSSGRGGGPGEFGQLMRIFRLPGDSVLAVGLDERYAVFDARGALARTGRLYVRGIPYGYHLLSPSTIAVSTSITGPTPTEGIHGGEFQLKLTTFDDPSRTLDIGPRIPWNRVYLRGRRTNPMPFGVNPSAAAGGGRVWLADPAGGQVLGFDEEGRPVATIQSPWPVRPISRDDRRRWIDASLDGLTGDHLRHDQQFFRQDAEFPDVMPAFWYYGLKVDHAGNVWVRRYSALWEGKAREWAVFNRSGVQIAQLEIPRALFSSCGREWGNGTCKLILYLGEDFLLMRQFDELGVLRVTLHRIQKR